MTSLHPGHPRLRAAVTAVGTGLVTLALLAGLPWVLWEAAGVPWPQEASSWQDLTDRLADPVSDPLMVELLALFGWTCWAAFTASILREILWYAAHLPHLLRDRRTHHDHLATLSVRRSLAALCVGTLVVALLTMWRPHPVAAQQHAGLFQPTGVGTVAMAPAFETVAARTPLTDTGPASPSGRQRHSAYVEYVVVEGDTLWDIAHAHLGDALKWPRIYALNKDRVQTDGARLTDPDRIRPGWRLTLPLTRIMDPHPVVPPASASGPSPSPSATASHNIATPSTTNEPTAPSEHPARHHQADEDEPTGRREHAEAAAPRGKPPAHVEQPESRPAAIGLGTAGLIGITTAAGLLAARRYWYWHTNRRCDEDDRQDVPALSPLVDKAAQAAHAATRLTPASVSAPDPDALITRQVPPKPPHSADTITIGTRDDNEVQLGELADPGGCSWTGPGAEAAARALLIGILTAAERQRPHVARTTAIVPRDLADRLLPGLPTSFSALTQARDLAHAIQAAERHLIAHARAVDEADDTSASAGLTRHPAPGGLLLLAVPDPAHTGQLQALAARSCPGTLIVLTLDTTLPGAASWHIAQDATTPHYGPDGRTSTVLRLFHLTREAARDVTDVLLTAHGQHRRLRTLPAQNRPTTSSHEEDRPQASTQPASKNSRSPDEQPTGCPQDEPAPRSEERPLPPHDGEPQPKSPTAQPSPSSDSGRKPACLLLPAAESQQLSLNKPVRIQVFGPVTLHTRGHGEPIGMNLRGEVHEFLALLAAHPTGLLTSDIAEKLHIKDGTEQNALKNLRRAVRRTLRAATNVTAQEFILRQGELHKLHPDLVESDLADFGEKLKNAFNPARARELGELLPTVCEALSHYRGPFAQGSDYLWAEGLREHFTTQATDAAIRLARATERASAEPPERDSALAVLERLCTLHPDRERLAQHTIRLYQAAGRHDAARNTFERLQCTLHGLGLAPDQATRALITPRTKASAAR